MSQIRKKISSDDQGAVIGKMLGFRDIHDKIMDMDNQLKEMQEQKEMLLTELSLARADEDMLMADFEFKYGPGRLDTRTMEWVETQDVQEIDRIKTIN